MAEVDNLPSSSVLSLVVVLVGLAVCLWLVGLVAAVRALTQQVQELAESTDAVVVALSMPAAHDSDEVARLKTALAEAVRQLAAYPPDTTRRPS